MEEKIYYRGFSHQTVLYNFDVGFKSSAMEERIYYDKVGLLILEPEDLIVVHIYR